MLKSKVLEHFGGIQATADALGITKQAVWAWKKIIPLSSAFQISMMTNWPIDPKMYRRPKKSSKVAA